jgi:hypothetical protein
MLSIKVDQRSISSRISAYETEKKYFPLDIGKTAKVSYYLRDIPDLTELHQKFQI